MVGNILVEVRKIPQTLSEEGYPEIFAFSVIEKNDDIVIQVADFSLDFVELDKKYEKTYIQAKKALNLAKFRHGANCTAINALLSDEVSEEVWMDSNVLRILNLNV